MEQNQKFQFPKNETKLSQKENPCKGLEKVIKLIKTIKYFIQLSEF